MQIQCVLFLFLSFRGRKCQGLGNSDYESRQNLNAAKGKNILTGERGRWIYFFLKKKLIVTFTLTLFCLKGVQDLSHVDGAEINLKFIDFRDTKNESESLR